MNDRVSSFEEYLAKYGTLTYSTRGVSMEPLLRQGRDLCVVKRKGAERCRVGDVALFRRDGKYLLHRVVQVRDDDYVCLGDNVVNMDYGVKDEDIIGVLVGVVRKGKEYSTDDLRYRIYTAWILRTQGLRLLKKRAWRKLRKLLCR